MATINNLGNITARCPGCKGALATYEWLSGREGRPHGVVNLGNTTVHYGGGTSQGVLEHRMYRCGGCGVGGLALLAHGGSFPLGHLDLRHFFKEVGETLDLPPEVPPGIQNEFREAEACLSEGFLRAAAGLFRSVLDKTLRANGYKLKNGTTLEQQIDLASLDGVITESRRRRAHDEVRVLGNDVLHDEWREIPLEDVEAAHHYVQRILEDFYDERGSTLKVLIEKRRLPDPDEAKQV